MFHRLFASFFFLVASLSILAAATGTPTTTVTVPSPTVTPGAPANQCNGSNNLQCCNSLERADSTAVGLLLGLLGVVIQGVEGLVGITCSPINILGIGQNSCSSQPVCCSNNDFKGIIAIGCVPININL